MTAAVLVAFFAILIWISQGVGGKTREIAMRFEPASSMPTLSPGAGIFVGGQRVGRVTGARLVSTAADAAQGDNKDARFYVWVEAEIQDSLVLRSDCSIVAEGPPLGGEGLLKLDLGKAPDLFSGEFIEGAPPAGFAAILSSLQSEFDGANPTSLLGQIKSQLDPREGESLIAKLLKSVEDVNAMTASLAREMGSQEKATLLAKIHAIIDNLNGMTGALRAELASGQKDALMGKVHLAMDSMNTGLSAVSRVLSGNEDTINRTFRNVEETTEHIARETDSSRPESLLAHIKAAGDELNKVLEDLHTVTGTAREVVILNRENIDKMLVNFKESSDHMKNGLKYVLRHPWRLLNEPKLKEIKQQAIFDAARNFADAATRVDDAASQLRVLAELHGGNIPSDSPELARIQKDLVGTREGYKKAEQELWRQLNID